MAAEIKDITISAHGWLKEMVDMPSQDRIFELIGVPTVKLPFKGLQRVYAYADSDNNLYALFVVHTVRASGSSKKNSQQRICDDITLITRTYGDAVDVILKITGSRVPDEILNPVFVLHQITFDSVDSTQLVMDIPEEYMKEVKVDNVKPLFKGPYDLSMYYGYMLSIMPGLAGIPCQAQDNKLNWGSTLVTLTWECTYDILCPKKSVHIMCYDHGFHGDLHCYQGCIVEQGDNVVIKQFVIETPFTNIECTVSEAIGNMEIDRLMYRFKNNKDVIAPYRFGNGYVFPVDTLTKMYKALDAAMSTVNKH